MRYAPGERHVLSELTSATALSRAKFVKHCRLQVDVWQRGQVSQTRSTASPSSASSHAHSSSSLSARLSRLTSLDNFAVLGGFADFMSAGLFLDGAGCITGLANLAPVRKAFFLSFSLMKSSSSSFIAWQKTCMQLYKATTDHLKSPTLEALDEVRRLQGIVSRGDWPVIKGGIAGPKYILDRIRGYGGAPRRPLLPMEAKDGEKMLAAFQEILDHEKTL